MSSASQCLLTENKVIEGQTEKRIQLDHRMDSLILLVYVVLLVLSVITIWTFKHRRFRYFHETGLSVIYGLIVGIVLRYGIKPSQPSVEYHELSNNLSFNSSCGSWLPPEKIVARLPVRDHAGRTNLSISFQYGFEQLASSEIPFNYKATFNPEIFFNVLLPPIIFSAGYNMKRHHFFKNIVAILTYAFLGTFLSALMVGIICYGFTRIISSLSSLLSFSDCLLFGAIISATDPVTVLTIFNDLGVDVNVYALVFGESVLNDALAIALSQSVEQYSSTSTGNFDASAFLLSISHFLAMFGGSFFIGVIVGALTALLTKFTHIREHPLLETALFVLMSYSTFLLAETVGFTGIVAVLFCGIMQAHYTFNNLSEESKLWTKEFFELLNFLSENFVFAYIGVSTFTFQQHYWDVRFVFIALLACIVGRAANVYPLSALINLCRGHRPSCIFKRPPVISPQHATAATTATSSTTGTCASDRAGPTNFETFRSGDVSVTHSDLHSGRALSSTLIPMNVQHMLFFSGLRGAMAFSLAIRNTSSTKRQMFFSTTIVVVMITVLLCGGLVLTMLNWLNIRTCVDDSDKPDAGSTTMHSDNLRGGKRSRSFFNHCWSRFDRFYLMPLLTNRGPPLTDSVPWCCFGLAKLLTTTEQRSQSLESNSTSRINLCDSGVDRINLTGSNPAVLFLHDKQLANRLSLPPSLPSLQLDTATLEPQTYQYTPLIQFEDCETPRSDCFPSAVANTSEEQINRTTPTPTATSDNALFIHQRLM